MSNCINDILMSRDTILYYIEGYTNTIISVNSKHMQFLYIKKNSIYCEKTKKLAVYFMNKNQKLIFNRHYTNRKRLASL